MSAPQFVAVILLILLRLNGVLCKINDSIEYYQNLITTETDNALLYQPPEDAREYQANSEIPIDLGSYDFIVIGAGSAGTVIANRLSEISNWNVLLLEAGRYSNEINGIPAMYVLGVLSHYNWGYRSVPQTTACLGVVNESCTIPTGRGVGGSTLINGLIYSRGHPADFNKWAELTGDPSWAYENVLEYFKKSEDFNQTDLKATVDWEYHGLNGNLNVEHHNPSIALKQIFLRANKELGYNITDYNSPNPIGGSIVQYNTKRGRRHDHATAFVFPAMNRPNLEVLSSSYVTKLTINNVTKEATGCTFTRGGKTYVVSASKEVILSAGAISSPRILMSSGLGPKEHLEDIGVPVVEDLPVGQSLREHVSPFGIQFSSNMSAPDQNLPQTIIEYLNGIGPLTSNTLSHVIGWYRSNKGEAHEQPDLELVTDMAGEPSELGKKFLGWKNETWDNFSENQNVSFTFNVLLLHPRSVGSVRLKSDDPFDYPLIDYKLLSDPANHDIDILYEGIQFCMKLVETKAFKSVAAKFEATPLPACKDFEFLSKDYWYCFLRQTSLAMFHPVGTCPMGKDPLKGAVVDSNLRVFGVKKLRVADASVFPLTLSAHPSAGCTMIGEKISDVIKAEYLAFM